MAAFVMVLSCCDCVRSLCRRSYQYIFSDLSAAFRAAVALASDVLSDLAAVWLLSLAFTMALGFVYLLFLLSRFILDFWHVFHRSCGFIDNSPDRPLVHYTLTGEI